MSWKPISTAPRDGTPIDVWHKTAGRITETWWDSDDQVWTCMFEDTDLTHWMPIPEAPVTEAEVTHE
jgi:hypothetical protein